MVKCKNDGFIEELINDPLYDILPNGEILTRVARTGQVYIDTSVWRKLVVNCSSRGGYRKIKYHYKWLQLHRVIYRKFIGELDPNLEINHKDGNPSNNSIGNLELITIGKNLEHSYRVLGRVPRVNYQEPKLSKEMAREIRLLHSQGWPNKKLREKFGVCKNSIRYIIRNLTWKEQ